MNGICRPGAAEKIRVPSFETRGEGDYREGPRVRV